MNTNTEKLKEKEELIYSFYRWGIEAHQEGIPAQVPEEEPMEKPEPLPYEEPEEKPQEVPEKVPVEVEEQ